MITIRLSQDRGHAQHGWLESYHSFSFADYYDPQWMGFRSLRVINEDYISAGQGFGSHPHRDMEIITYVLKGQLKHKDSMGNEGIIKAGEIQKMSAGSGVVHSEFNASATEPVHLLQIWIVPQSQGLEPSYEQHLLPPDQNNSLILFPAAIHQDMRLFRGRLSAGKNLEHVLGPGRAAWVQVVSGSAKFNDRPLETGDGAAIEDESQLNFSTGSDCEFLLFDLR